MELNKRIIACKKLIKINFVLLPNFYLMPNLCLALKLGTFVLSATRAAALSLSFDRDLCRKGSHECKLIPRPCSQNEWAYPWQTVCSYDTRRTVSFARLWKVYFRRSLAVSTLSLQFLRVVALWPFCHHDQDFYCWNCSYSWLWLRWRNPSHLIWTNIGFHLEAYDTQTAV